MATITAIGNHGMLKKKKLFIACHAVEQTMMTIASRMSERKAPLRRRGRTYGAVGPPGPAAPGAPAGPAGRAGRRTGPGSRRQSWRPWPG